MRRCESMGACNIGVPRKFAFMDLPVADVLHNPNKQWNKLVNDANKNRRFAKHQLNVDWVKYNPTDYIFTHASIVASVATEPNKYRIIEPCDELVNANGNAWTNEVLIHAFPTFIGAENYFEHCQIPELSKGKILDAVLRPVTYVGKNGKNKADINYCDILIATHRRHDSIVSRILDGTLSTLSMGCGIAGTKIITDIGCFKNIEDIVVGDTVISHQGKSREVTGLFKKHVDEVPLHSIHYCGMYEPLTLTAEHPILVAKKESVKCICNDKRPCRLDHIQSMCTYYKTGKQRLCGRDKKEYQYDIQFVPISNVVKGDYLVKSYPVEVNDDIELTHDFCRLLGLYLGDGCLGWQWNRKERVKRYPLYVEFCFNIKEKSTLVDEVIKIANLLNLSDKVRVKEITSRNGIYVRINDRSLAEKIFLHCGEGSHTKFMSDSMMHLPHDKQMEIISGLMDTDGCYYQKKKTMHLVTASENLWNQIHLMLLRLNIANSQNKVLRKSTGFRKKYSTEMYYQYSIYISSPFVNKIKSLKNIEFGKPFTGMQSERCFFYQNYYLCQVKDNTMIHYAGTVYNFSVEEDESYLINNMSVHNCLANQCQCSWCGKITDDNIPNCAHIDQKLKQYMIDPKTKKRYIVAELCGALDPKTNEYIPNSCIFIEASWVEQPAFRGAVINYMIDSPMFDNSVQKAIEERELSQLFNTDDILTQLKVADVHHMMAIRLALKEARSFRYKGIIENIAFKSF